MAPSAPSGGQGGAWWWLSPVGLGVLPVVVICSAGGVGLWLAAWFGDRAAAAPDEALPGLVLAIGLALGGRLEGSFVNVNTLGFGGVALALPLLSGLLISRWVRLPSVRIYAAGLMTTAVVHTVTATALGVITVSDPTSFATAQVSWLPSSSLLVSVFAWGICWLVTNRGMARTLWIGLSTTMVVGAGAAALGAVQQGLRPDLLPTAALVGSGYGPNLVAFSSIWAPGVQAGIIGERQPDVETFVGLARASGWWLLLIPAIALGLLCVASFRSAHQLETAREFWLHLRDAVLVILVAVPLTAAASSPRVWMAEDGPLWVGVPGAPASLVLPSLVLLVLATVPQVVVAIRTGEYWPRDILESAADLALRLPRPSRPTPSAPWIPAAAPPPSPNPVATPAGVRPPEAAWSPPASGGHPVPAAPPVHNPFDDTDAPPVSAAWSKVAAAPSDPGAYPARTPAPPTTAATAPPATNGADSADAWRHAPPPSARPAEPVDGRREGGLP